MAQAGHVVKVSPKGSLVHSTLLMQSLLYTALQALLTEIWTAHSG